ncbi:hypothetical protein CMESO_225 (nucleomorph) [Chroomonas mesostigmatica CCMP1168]|uniref:Uncharacterized protein n=1 Tax=Chroomonas mesostigmatica CCMP1168 TaxID=1195612 RepID=J7G7X1_9CRYP|nr:hypothetical protein CMESO_225 [Chroomonas mesostigmatica CCMP1168]
MKLNFLGKIQNKKKKKKKIFIIFQKLFFFFLLNNLNLNHRKKTSVSFLNQNLYFLSKMLNFDSNNPSFFFHASCLAKSYAFFSYIFSRRQSYSFEIVKLKCSSKKKNFKINISVEKENIDSKIYKYIERKEKKIKVFWENFKKKNFLFNKTGLQIKSKFVSSFFYEKNKKPEVICSTIFFFFFHFSSFRKEKIKRIKKKIRNKKLMALIYLIFHRRKKTVIFTLNKTFFEKTTSLFADLSCFAAYFHDDLFKEVFWNYFKFFNSGFLPFLIISAFPKKKEFIKNKIDLRDIFFLLTARRSFSKSLLFFVNF